MKWLNINILIFLSFSLIGLVSDVDGQNLSKKENIVKTGARVLVENGFKSLEGKKVGLITNHTGMVGHQHIADLMNEAPNVNLTTLFGPEHGIRGDDNTDFQTDESTGLPVYSLYGEHRKPTADMLEDVDVLVFDIQDIGPRFYTYISTMSLAMEAAAKNNISFMVLDRPNPLGGELPSGFVREPEFKSFIAYLPIPITHGLTIGELATMAKEEGMLEGVSDLDLSVIKMKGWHRDMLWPDTKLQFVGPSPNMPDFSTALIYPGACFWERVKGSEGRGTPFPFMQLGTFWANSDSIVNDLNGRDIPGLRFEKATFITSETQIFHGIRYVITDMHDVRPVEAGIHILEAFYEDAQENNKKFLEEGLKSHAGTERLYNMLTNGTSAEDVIASWKNELSEFDEMRHQYFLYGDS